MKGSAEAPELDEYVKAFSLDKFVFENVADINRFVYRFVDSEQLICEFADFIVVHTSLKPIG